MSKKQLGPSPMIFPMPAVLIATYGDDDVPDAMTAAWAAACCHKPPCLGVAIRHNRLTFRNVTTRKGFTVNVPRATQAKEVDYLGIVSGAKRPDKLAVAGMAIAPASEVNAPILVDCPVNVECKLVGKLALGSHTWFAGEVVAVHADEGVVDADGAIDLAALDPLVYATSTHDYHALGGVVARAYAVGKQLIED